MSAGGEDSDALDSLVELAVRIAGKLAVRRGLSHYADEAMGVALTALARAMAAHDPGIGKLRRYAAVWVLKEVNAELDGEAERCAVERGERGERGEHEDAEGVHPSLVADEITLDVMDPLLDLYVGEALRSDGEAVFLKKEACGALHREIADLPEDDRRLVELHWFEGRSWKEVGAALGIADRTARERDQKIRAYLKERLVAWDRVRPLRRKT